ncbi:zf-TFIIB domain-containing protein [Natronomonas gomsonensis]|nr:zf-TFIIB domain-containing protein [Natronomonas gomsonensis]
MTRFCPHCGTRLKRGTTTGSGIPNDYCPNCSDGGER